MSGVKKTVRGTVFSREVRGGYATRTDDAYAASSLLARQKNSDTRKGVAVLFLCVGGIRIMNILSLRLLSIYVIIKATSICEVFYESLQMVQFQQSPIC